jgi:hypothetical protein
MKQKVVIVIDNRVSKLELIEEIVYKIDAMAQCIGFVFGDEALRVINDEMTQAPSHIFIDANLRRTTISKCLSALRSNARLNSCCITVFSDTMPLALADAYCSMGADFAFATPLTVASGIDLVQCIIPATRQAKSRPIVQ